MQSYQSMETESPKEEFDDLKNCGPLSGLFENMTPQLVNTVGVCLESDVPQLNKTHGWEMLFNQKDSWYNDVIDKVAGDDNDFKYASTTDELFDMLKVDVR